MRFSANLGFLWSDRPLPDAIRAAGAAGFDAVECHWPYDTAVAEVNAALGETGLQMLSLNTVRGDIDAGDNGLSAVPGREAEARAAIDQAIAYAQATGTGKIHVLAGNASGRSALRTFVANLKYACGQAQPHGITILIEPLNHYDCPGYFLTTSQQALDILLQVGADNLKIMFDCYHIQIIEGDLCRRIAALLPWIGHIQFASVPERGAPGHGEVNYAHVFQHIWALGYTAPLGAEYRVEGSTEATLGWVRKAKAIGQLSAQNTVAWCVTRRRVAPLTAPWRRCCWCCPGCRCSGRKLWPAACPKARKPRPARPIRRCRNCHR